MSNDDIQMNWTDPTVASVHSNPADVSERSLSIEASLPSVKDYGWMGITVTVDGADDLPAAVAMMQAALDARPAEFQDVDESVAVPPMMDFD